MKLTNIEAQYGRVLLSDHENANDGVAFLYGIETEETGGETSLISLSRAQRRTLAIALLGYDEQFVNDYGATIPSAREAIGSDGRSYEPDDPTLDAPPITDADEPDEDAIEARRNDPTFESPEYLSDYVDEPEAGDYRYGLPDEYNETNDPFAGDGGADWDPNLARDLYTQETLDRAVLAADQSGFERGYDSAVDDYRHGLWVDEVEARS